MNLKRKIKKRLSVYGFKKYGNACVKRIENNYYLVYMIQKSFDFDMLNEPEAAGKEYERKRDCPHCYDVLFDVEMIDNFDDTDPYFDGFSSLRLVTETPKKNWVRWTEESEDSIVDDIELKFKNYCIDNFAEKHKEERSIYDFVIKSYKKCKPYLWFMESYRLSELALYDKKYKEAWFWYEKAVEGYYKGYIFHRYERRMPIVTDMYDLFNSETFDINVAKKASFDKLEEISESKIKPEREIGYFLDLRKNIEAKTDNTGDDTLSSVES